MYFYVSGIDKILEGQSQINHTFFIIPQREVQVKGTFIRTYAQNAQFTSVIRKNEINNIFF